MDRNLGSCLGHREGGICTTRFLGTTSGRTIEGSGHTLLFLFDEEPTGPGDLLMAVEWYVVRMFESLRKSSKVFESLRKSSKVFESLRKSSKVFESLRTSSNVFESLRTSSKVFESLRKSSNVFESLRKSSNVFESLRKSKRRNVVFGPRARRTRTYTTRDPNPG